MLTSKKILLFYTFTFFCFCSKKGTIINKGWPKNYPIHNKTVNDSDIKRFLVKYPVRNIYAFVMVGLWHVTSVQGHFRDFGLVIPSILNAATYLGSFLSLLMVLPGNKCWLLELNNKWIKKSPDCFDHGNGWHAANTGQFE